MNPLYALMVACVAGNTAAGKFDGLKDCETCVAAGHGWSFKHEKCGGFANKQCDSVAFMYGQKVRPRLLEPPAPNICPQLHAGKLVPLPAVEKQGSLSAWWRWFQLPLKVANSAAAAAAAAAACAASAASAN